MRDSIGFDAALIPLIQSGRKTLTYRLGWKWGDIKVGKRLRIIRSDTVEDAGSILITRKAYSRFDALPVEDDRHEPYHDREEMRRVFTEYYGYVPDDSDKVLVLEFTITADDGA